MLLSRLNPINLLLIFLVTVVLGGFQTTFWFQIFGSLPAPLLWLNLVLYLTLYRKPLEGILTIYMVGLFLSPFTAMKVSLLWLVLLVVFMIMSFVKKRVFWSGSRYFALASIGIAITYHLTYLIFSRWLEPTPASFNFFHRFFEILFTALSAIPMYALLSTIDQLTHKETLPEGGSVDT